MKNCQNCGHQCHCGTSCIQQHTDGDGKQLEIECCKECRHEKSNDFDPDEVKYDTLDYDSFNGA
jgi:hypothetical protein